MRAKLHSLLPAHAYFTHQRDQKVVNFEQISTRKRAHAPLDRGDVFLEVGWQFDLRIHGDRS